MGILESLGLKRRSFDDVKIKTVTLPGLIFDTNDRMPRFVRIEGNKDPYFIGDLGIKDVLKNENIILFRTGDEKLNNKLYNACLEVLGEHYVKEVPTLDESTFGSLGLNVK